LFIPAILKNKAKTDLKERRIEKLTQRVLYWFTLYQELHPVLNNHWEFIKSSKILITHTTHQNGDIEPFKNTPPLANTPQISEQPLNLHNDNSHKNTVFKRERNEYTWVQSHIKAKWIQYNPIPLLENIQSF